MNCRNLAMTTALVTAALALQGCASQSGTVSTTPTTLQSFINAANAWMPFVTALGIGVAAFVPGGPALVGPITAGTSAVELLLNTISATMTAAQAQPTAQQIVTAMQGTMAALKQLTAGIPPGNTATSVQTAISQAGNVVTGIEALVTQLAGLVPAKPATAALGPTDLLHIRRIN